MNQQEFENEYLGSFEPTEKDRRLYELAEEYERRCETYDRTVCSGRDEKGIAIPVFAHEVAMIGRHASRVRQELLNEVRSLGFDVKDFLVAIRDVNRR